MGAYYYIASFCFNEDGSLGETRFEEEGNRLSIEGCVEIFKDYLERRKYRTLRSLSYEYDPSDGIHTIIATVTDWYGSPFARNRKEVNEHVIRFWKEG